MQMSIRHLEEMSRRIALLQRELSINKEKYPLEDFSGEEFTILELEEEYGAAYQKWINSI